MLQVTHWFWPPAQQGYSHNLDSLSAALMDGEARRLALVELSLGNLLNYMKTVGHSGAEQCKLRPGSFRWILGIPGKAALPLVRIGQEQAGQEQAGPPRAIWCKTCGSKNNCRPHLLVH